MAEQRPTFRVDSATHEVFLGERRLNVRLSRQEFALLRELYERRGEVCTREELSQAIWGSLDIDGRPVPRSDDHMLHALVHRVRGKLRRAGVELNDYLTNVAGVGYRLDATPTGDATGIPEAPPLARRLLLPGTAVTGLLAVAVALAVVFWPGGDDDGRTGTLAATGSPAGAAELCAAEMLDPPPGSTLPGDTVTFRWSAGCGLNKYDLWVGCTPGAVDFFNPDDGQFLEATVSGLPTDGGPVFVRLSSSDGTEEGSFSRWLTFTSADTDETGLVAYFEGTHAGWYDTGIDIPAGADFSIQACGQLLINSTGYPSFKAGGDPECPGVPWKFDLPGPELPFYALIGRIGENGTPFLVGTELTRTDEASGGRLYLAANDNNYADNGGGFRATVHVAP